MLYIASLKNTQVFGVLVITLKNSLEFTNSNQLMI